jgi:tRNA(fMet)-specific endonuclease VapC
MRYLLDTNNLIAAHARSVTAILATNNVRAFSRVPDRRVEDWMS